MSNRTLKTFFFSCALLFAAAAPAAAQGEFGAGFSVLMEEEFAAKGFTVDYSRAFRPMTGGSMGWVVDLSLNNEEGARVISALAGVRLKREATEKVNWFAQATAGLGRISPTGDDAEVCDEFELSCSESAFAIYPGVGVNFAVSPKVNIRAQFDFALIMFEGDAFKGPRIVIGLSFPIE